MPDSVECCLDDTKGTLITLENELTRLALTIKSPEAIQAVKLCVYHIILNAITLSKDPKNNVLESKRLFQLAQEIIAQAGLEQEHELKQRLSDLINAMVDQDDLAIQLRFAILQNIDYFKSITGMVRNESVLRTEEYETLHELLIRNQQLLSRLGKGRSVFKVFMISFMAFAVLLFTIASSVVIILALLASNSPSGAAYEKSSFVKPPPAIEKPVE